MRLTKKKAIEIAIELWTWLAETGCEWKIEWTEWDKYGEMENDCPLCECSGSDCDGCSYHLQFGNCEHQVGKELTIFDRWNYAKTPKTRKKYAKLFLEQLKELK